MSNNNRRIKHINRCNFSKNMINEDSRSLVLNITEMENRKERIRSSLNLSEGDNIFLKNCVSANKENFRAQIV